MTVLGLGLRGNVSAKILAEVTAVLAMDQWLLPLAGGAPALRAVAVLGGPLAGKSKAIQALEVLLRADGPDGLSLV